MTKQNTTERRRDNFGIKKSRYAPLRPALNSVCDRGCSAVATLNPVTHPKITMPTSSKQMIMRRFTLFSQGESYVDVPPLSRFLHIERNKQHQPVLVCQVEANAPRVEWRRVVCVPAGTDLRQYSGWYGIPRLSGTNLWFLDPKIYDHNAKPVEP